jgi:chemotaxis protein CheC
LNADQEDAIREIFSIGIGRAAATLSELIGTRIELSVPRVALRMLEAEEFQVQSPDGPDVAVSPDVAIIQDFRGDLSGRSALVLPHASGLRLAQLLGEVAQPVDELDLEMSGILTEVGNIMLNSVLGALANTVGTRLVYSVPQFYSARPLNLLLSYATQDPRALLKADADFWVRHDSIHGSLLVVMDIRGLEAVLGVICGADA